MAQAWFALITRRPTLWTLSKGGPAVAPLACTSSSLALLVVVAACGGDGTVGHHATAPLSESIAGGGGINPAGCDDRG